LNGGLVSRKNKKNKDNSSSGKSPTKFMERPGTQPDEEKDLFQDQSGDEGVNSLDSTLNAGQDPADERKPQGPARPDNDGKDRP
jgi:hypothetical protein